MIRKTLTTLSLIGLLLSVGLWGVTQFVDFRIDFGGQQTFTALTCGRHAAQFLHSDFPTSLQGWRSSCTPTTSPLVGNPGFPRLDNAGDFFILYVPYWAAVLPCGVVLACSSINHRRRKRKKLGLCVKCGYDLRGSKDRCPECGTGFEGP